MLKAIHLAHLHRSRQGRTLESRSLSLLFSQLQWHLEEEDLEAFVVFPWNKTNRIQVF